MHRCPNPIPNLTLNKSTEPCLPPLGHFAPNIWGSLKTSHGEWGGGFRLVSAGGGLEKCTLTTLVPLKMQPKHPKAVGRNWRCQSEHPNKRAPHFKSILLKTNGTQMGSKWDPNPNGGTGWEISILQLGPTRGYSHAEGGNMRKKRG